MVVLTAAKWADMMVVRSAVTRDDPLAVSTAGPRAETTAARKVVHWVSH